MKVQQKNIEIGRLDVYPRNPRKGNVEMVKASLAEFGQYRTIVVRPHAEKDGYEVLAGNHTLLAARELGIKNLSCSVVECDDDTAARIVLADNRSSDLATYDDADLLELLNSLETLDGTGYAGIDLTELTAGLEESLSPKALRQTRIDGAPGGVTVPPSDTTKFGTREEWEESTRRLIVLDMSTEEYLEATDALKSAALAFGTKNNTETILTLLRRMVDDGK